MTTQAAKQTKSSLDQRAMAEIQRLVEASRNGDLKARADASAFSGNVAKVMNSINTILKEALGPVNFQVAALEMMAEGQLSTRVTQEFKGDHNRGKDALNSVADIAGKAQTEIVHLIDASKNGDCRPAPMPRTL